MTRRYIQALIVAVLILVGGCVAPPAHADYLHHRPAGGCPTDYWKSHKNGPCGWGTVSSLITRVFHHVYGPRAHCIAWRESRYNPRATNGQYRGLYQFGASWYAGKFDAYNPVQNTLRAWSGSRYGTNWAPWGWAC